MPMIAKIIRKLKALKKKVLRRHTEKPKEKETENKKRILTKAINNEFRYRKFSLLF
jgi:hypothetical protein